MCLQTEWMSPKIAEEDMVVYKELEDDLYSPYQKFKYKLHQLYETKLEETFDFTHFDEETYEWKERMYNFDIILKSIGRGFHAFVDRHRIYKGNLPIFKCIIPKGAEYYMDGTGLIVSNKIKIVEKV